MKERGTWIALAAIVAVGAVLRVAGAGAQPLWTDEALTLMLVRTPWPDLLRYPVDNSGPLYYWAHALLADNGTLVGARLPAILFGTATILPAFLAGREMGGKRGGIAAALVVALLPALVHYGHEARAYSLLVLLVMLAAWAGLRALGGSGRALAGFVAASALALYTHPTALLAVGPMAAVLGWSWIRRRRPLRWPMAMVALALLYLPEANRLRIYQKKVGRWTWLEQPTAGDAARLTVDIWTGLGLAAGTALLLILLAALVVDRRRLDRWKLAFALSTSVSAVLLYLAGVAGRPLMMDRTVLASAVGIALLWALVAGSPRWKLAPLGLLVAVGVGGLVLHGLDRPKEDWRGAARALPVDGTPWMVCPRWQAAALLAATDGRERPDVLIPAVHGITLVPRGGGWAGRLYDFQYHDEWAHRRKREQFPVRNVALPMRSMMVVTGECTAEERQQMAQWFGPHRTVPVWQGRGVTEKVVLRVERWEGADVPRTLVLQQPGPERRRK